jgi:lipoprotein-anchoring transpeptidase ErfK/SrfK
MSLTSHERTSQNSQSHWASRSDRLFGIMNYDPYTSLRRRPWQPLFVAAPAVAALVFAGALALKLPGGAKLAPTTAPTAQIKPQLPAPPASAVEENVAVAAGPATVSEAGYLLRSALPDMGPLEHGKWVWNDRAAPATGPMLILVDVGTQTVSVFRDGHEIGYSTIIYGADHKPTPLGRFPIKWKKKDHWSSTYEDAPMPYTLRMTDDGVAIHGAETIKPDYATNGCVGLPIEFAKQLFDVVKVGDVIIVKDKSGLKIGDRVPNAA